MGISVKMNFDDIEGSVLKAQERTQNNAFITGGKPILGYLYRLMEQQEGHRGSTNLLSIQLTAYPIVKITPKGFRYQRIGDSRQWETFFMLKDTWASYAHQSIQRAIDHYVRRKLCQQQIYRDKLTEVEHVLEIAQLGAKGSYLLKQKHPDAYLENFG